MSKYERCDEKYKCFLNKIRCHSDLLTLDLNLFYCIVCVCIMNHINNYEEKIDMCCFMCRFNGSNM